MTFTAAVTQTPQHSFLNGGTGVESRQYFARPTQHTPNGPRITPGIAGMVPGEFRTIWLSAENQIFSTQVEDTGGWYNGLDWTPRAAWSAESQQIVIGMRRGTYKVIAYSDVTGDWRELPTPIPYGRSTGGTAHFYGFIDDRPDGKVLLYSLQNEDFLLDPATETYEGPRAKHLLTNGGNGSMIAYNGAGEVIKYSGDAKRWLAYNEATDTWTLRASSLPNGMHALLEYNAAADRYLLVGGTLTSQKATLVTPAGVATPVTDCPQPISMASGSWIAYHPAGCWLVRGWPDGAPGNLYACWPNSAKTDVVWQDLGVAPDNGLTYPTAAVDYDRGVIYIVSTTGLHAYKLPEVTDPSGAVAISPQGATAHFSGAIPGIAQPRTLSPVAGQVQATGHAPAVLQGDAQAVAPQAGHAQAHGYAPTLSQPITIAPGKGIVTATGYSPTVDQTASVRPQAGRIAAHGYAPTIGQSQTIAPTRAQTVATGHTPIVVKGVRVDPQTGRVEWAGHAPVIAQGGARTVAPAAGHVRAMGWAPSVTTMPIGGYPSSVTITVPSGRTITLRPR